MYENVARLSCAIRRMGVKMNDKALAKIMMLQTKINDHLEIMSENMLYAVSEFNLESWWNDLESIYFLIASEEV